MNLPANSGRSLRPILPAALLGAAEDNNDDPASPSHRLGKAKRTKLDRACLACSRRKAKCDGLQPNCSLCVRRGVQCEYPQGGTVQTLKRKLDDVQHQLNVHQELYGIIQSKSEGESAAIVRRIRLGNDAETVLSHLKDGDLLMQLSLVPETWYRYSFPMGTEMPAFLHRYDNPYLKSRVYEQALRGPPGHSGAQQALSTPEMFYQAPYHAAEIVLPDLDRARPSQWTVVSKDDELLRKMLKSYFFQQYPMFPFFHKGLFIHDMAKGGSRFCSSLLVNAVLAAACQGYKDDPHRVEFWNPSTLHYQFLAEFRRIRELEAEKQSLPNVQAGLVMSCLSNMNGIDKVGWAYTVQSVALANAMRLFDPPPAAYGPRMRIGHCFTAWAVFAWQSTFCFSFLRPPLVNDPPVPELPDPVEQSWFYPETWIKYPTSRAPVPVQHGEHIFAVAGMRAIMNDISIQAFGTREQQLKLTLEQALKFRATLLSWFERLPASLSIQRAVLPHHMMLHMHYHNIMIMLFEPFTKADLPGFHSRLGEEPDSTSPEAIVIDAKIRFETVYRLYYLRHGFEFHDLMLNQFAMLIGFMALKSMSAIDDNNSNSPHDQHQPHQQLQLRTAVRSTILLSLRAMAHLATHTHLARAIYRLLTEAVARQDAALLAEAGAGGPAGEDEDSRHRALIADHVQSQFPINVVSIADDPESRRVDNLIAAYREMGLGSNGSGSGSEKEGQEKDEDDTWSQGD